MNRGAFVSGLRGHVTSTISRIIVELINVYLCKRVALSETEDVMDGSFVTIFLIHSLIRAIVENLGCLNYLLLVKTVRPNSLFSNVIFIFKIEVYSNALYYL